MPGHNDNQDLITLTPSQCTRPRGENEVCFISGLWWQCSTHILLGSTLLMCQDWQSGLCSFSSWMHPLFGRRDIASLFLSWDDRAVHTRSLCRYLLARERCCWLLCRMVWETGISLYCSVTQSWHCQRAFCSAGLQSFQPFLWGKQAYHGCCFLVSMWFIFLVIVYIWWHFQFTRFSDTQA